jgi:hypothetical protein
MTELPGTFIVRLTMDSDWRARSQGSAVGAREA